MCRILQSQPQRCLRTMGKCVSRWLYVHPPGDLLFPQGRVDGESRARTHNDRCYMLRDGERLAIGVEPRQTTHCPRGRRLNQSSQAGIRRPWSEDCVSGALQRDINIVLHAGLVQEEHTHNPCRAVVVCFAMCVCVCVSLVAMRLHVSSLFAPTVLDLHAKGRWRDFATPADMSRPSEQSGLAPHHTKARHGLTCTWRAAWRRRFHPTVRVRRHIVGHVFLSTAVRRWCPQLCSGGRDSLSGHRLDCLGERVDASSNTVC